MAVFLTAVLSLAACGGRKAATEKATPLSVRAIAVHAVDAPTIVDVVGSLRSSREAVIASKVMGTITEIRKAAGDRVRQGDVLVVVDSRDVAGQIAQAQGSLLQARAALAMAETSFRRFEQLKTRGAASELELDQARYQYDTARGAVAQADGAVATASSYKSYAEIPAPFDGRIVDRLCEVGDLAAPGRPLLKIEDDRRLRLEATLSESDLAAAHPGATVDVYVPSVAEQPLSGTIAEIVPAADPGTHTFLVKIYLPPDARLRSGLYGKAQLSVGTRRMVRVPRAAIQTRGGLTGVYVAEGTRATFRLVTVADQGSDSVEVLAGLSEGDRLIVSPPAALSEGAAVEVKP